jgi:predicted GNAT family N-acyltransferase
LKGREGHLVASARLTFHTTLEDSYRDVALWRRAGKHLPLPICDLGRLVVDPVFRTLGLANRLNKVRVAAAKESGAKSIMVTASYGNVGLLERLGFAEIGETIEFEDRPGEIFVAMQLD